MEITTSNESITKNGRKDGKWLIDLNKLYDEKKISEIKTITIRDNKYFPDTKDNNIVSKKIYTVECDVPEQLATLFSQGKLAVKNTKPKKADFQRVLSIKTDVQNTDYFGRAVRGTHDENVMTLDHDKYDKAVQLWEEKYEKASSYENIKLRALTIDKGKSHMVYTRTGTETETGTWDKFLFKVPFDSGAFTLYFRGTGTERSIVGGVKAITGNWDFVKKTFELINSKIKTAEPSKALKLANGIFGSTGKHFTRYKYTRELGYGEFIEEMIEVVRNCRKTIMSIKTEESKLPSLKGLMRAFLYFAKQANYRLKDGATQRMDEDWFWEVIVGNNETEPMIEDPSEIDDWAKAVEEFGPTTIEGLREGEVLEKLKEMLKKIKGWKKRCRKRKGLFEKTDGTFQGPNTPCKKFQALKF